MNFRTQQRLAYLGGGVLVLAGISVMIASGFDENTWRDHALAVAWTKSLVLAGVAIFVCAGPWRAQLRQNFIENTRLTHPEVARIYGRFGLFRLIMWTDRNGNDLDARIR